MKTVMVAVFLAFSLAPASFAWNCTQPGQIRVQVPAGTVGSGQGDGPGQVDTVEGITFQCQTPPTTTTPSNPGSTSSSTSSANSASNSSSNSASNATGGNSSSTATGGNQKQNQTQTANGGNASATGGNSTSSASDNGNGSNNASYSSQTNIAATKVPVATAIAPTVLPTNPCFKGMGLGVQTMVLGGSFGGGKIDSNCAILEAARLAPSPLARCKVYISNKYVKAAGVTLEDCLATEPQVSANADISGSQRTATSDVATTIVVPAPQITVNIPAPVLSAPVVNVVIPAPAPAPVAHVVRKKHATKPCPSAPPVCGQVKPSVWDNESLDGLQYHHGV